MLHYLKNYFLYLKTDNYNIKKIYGCQVKLQDYLVHKNLGRFISKSDYYANPNEYKCEFHTKVKIFLYLYM
jgi:hypothetical protein